jgi:hypothetical protein
MRKACIALAAFIALLVYINTSCGDQKKAGIAEGERLARTHCASCHAFPDPSLLDKKTWDESVLPKMAELMYVENYYDPYNASGPDGDIPATRVAPENLFPFEKWKKIGAYYAAMAPAQPLGRGKEQPAIQSSLPGFTAHYFYDKASQPLTTLVRFDTAQKQILFGDGSAKKLFVLDRGLRFIDSFPVPEGIADIHLSRNEAEVITMGILKPSDARLGKLTRSGKAPVLLLDSLQRPVQATYADLDDDGREDIIISEFGYRKGALAWWQNQGNDHYARHVLRALPGATRTEVYDFNKDGRPDIIALMAQADESVLIYYNEGHGKFREERVLQFPPAYGSNYMQLCDFNRDGLMDILTTNGDNGDFSIILKAYHGIRIFLNDGKDHFTEKTFLPVYGVQKAMPADMDNDGDIDLVSIAFFPDYEKLPQESFIYWENNGDDTYKRYTFDGVTNGRWMTLDVGDMDGDGDQDIILGSAFFTFGNVPQAYKDKWGKRPLSAVILENKLIH